MNGFVPGTAMSISAVTGSCSDHVCPPSVERVE
jgi:hypothetical protein